jgi:hypothetical protein
MATTIAGVAMAGGGGFVLKSVRTGKLVYNKVQTFSVQNEGDFCIIKNDLSDNKSYEFKISQIDDISVDITTAATNIVFGKNIVVSTSYYDFDYHIFEYGPAE